MFSSGIALVICSWDGLCSGRGLGYGLEPDGVGVGLIEAVACELSLSNKALGTSYSGHPSFGPLPGPVFEIKSNSGSGEVWMEFTDNSVVPRMYGITFHIVLSIGSHGHNWGSLDSQPVSI